MKFPPTIRTAEHTQGTFNIVFFKKVTYYCVEIVLDKKLHNIQA
jgi:hypothetical protein